MIYTRISYTYLFSYTNINKIQITTYMFMIHNCIQLIYIIYIVYNYITYFINYQYIVNFRFTYANKILHIIESRHHLIIINYNYN